MKKSASSRIPINRSLVKLFLFLWLVFSLTVTCLEAGDLQRQALTVYTRFLEDELRTAQERFSAEGDGLTEGQITADYLLTEVPMLEPGFSLPFLMNQAALQPRSFGMVLDQTGVVQRTGSSINDDYRQDIYCLWIHEGYLSYLVSGEKMVLFSPSTDAISFHFSCFRKGSYCLEGYHRTESDRNDPVGSEFSPADLITPNARTNPALLAGIEDRTLNFEMTSLMETNLLRGAWLCDSTGTPRWYLLAGLGWCPLVEAMRSLWITYLLSLLLFALVGLLGARSLHRKLSLPMGSLGNAINGNPITASEESFDYRYSLTELREISAGHQFNLQIQEAKLARAEAKELPEPTTSLAALAEGALDNLHALLIDRGVKVETESAEDYPVLCKEEAGRAAIREMVRDSLMTTQSGTTCRLRCRSYGGFAILELDTICKHSFPESILHDIWTSVYRIPDDTDQPGAKFKSAVEAIPGAFCSVQTTSRGILWQLGFPKA